MEMMRSFIIEKDGATELREIPMPELTGNRRW